MVIEKRVLCPKNSRKEAISSARLGANEGRSLRKAKKRARQSRKLENFPSWNHVWVLSMPHENYITVVKNNSGAIVAAVGMSQCSRSGRLLKGLMVGGSPLWLSSIQKLKKYSF